MNIGKLSVLAAAGAAVSILGTVAASAAPIVYTSRAAFLAATTNQSTDGFETAPAGGTTSYSTGYTGAGFTIKSAENYLASIDPAFSPVFYDWGSGDTMLFAQNGTVTFTLAPGRTAFGIDLMSILNYGATITIGGLSSNYNVATAGYPNRTFFGITSDTAITGFTLKATGGYGEFDNFTLASAVSAIPEPATWAMMIYGFGLVGGTMRHYARRIRA